MASFYARYGGMVDGPSKSRSGSETRQRSSLVQVRFTPEEHARLEAAAERAGMTVGAFMRHQCLGDAGPRAARRPPVERAALAQLLAQLGKCGSNVNQIARALNMDHPASGDIAPTMTALREAAAEITRLLGRSDR